MYKIIKSILISLSFGLLSQFPLSGMFYQQRIINPNKDGCIINAENGRLCDRQTLEATFEKRENTISQVNFYNFGSQDKNVYKVKAIPCLRQPRSGPCGFYSLFHLVQLYWGANLLNQNALNRLLGGNYAFQNSIKNGASSASNDIQNIANQKMRYFTENNFVVTDGQRDMNQPFTCDQYQNRIGREDYDSFINRIRQFQQNGTTQYLVISGSTNPNIPGIRLTWNNKNDRLNCLRGHWMALKIEWQGVAGQSPVVLSVAESGSPKDLRYAKLIHWYYYTFVHAHDFYRKNIEKVETFNLVNYESETVENFDPSILNFPNTKSNKAEVEEFDPSWLNFPDTEEIVSFQNIPDTKSNKAEVEEFDPSLLNFPDIEEVVNFQNNPDTKANQAEVVEIFDPSMLDFPNTES